MVDELSAVLLVKTFDWFSVFLGIILLIIALVVVWRLWRSQKTENKKEIIIKITDKARDRIRELLADYDKTLRSGVPYFRIEVSLGSCAERKYLLYWEAEKLADDIELDIKGLKVLVNKNELPLLDGSTIDYISLGLTNSGFKIENSNILSQCGCGTSHVK